MPQDTLKIKNVLLLRPPLHQRDKNAVTDVNVFFPPNGVLLLSSILKERDFSVTVKDMYDDDWEGVLRHFSGNNYDVVGITCLTGQHLNCFRAAEIAKKEICPPPIIIIGGPHPSASGIDTQILSHYPQIDFIVRGEGERTLVELFEKINTNGDLSSVKGITFRQKPDSIIRTQDREPLSDLDSLPLADYSFIDFSKTENVSDGRVNFSDNGKRIRYIPIISSRGCPNKCQFCAIFMGRKVRFRSAENVVGEIEHLHRTRGVSHFTFADDCFNASLPRAEKICRLILERKLAVTWTAMVRVRPLSEEFLRLAKRAGCLLLDFGVESGSREMLKTIGKNINPDDFLRAIKLTRKVGLKAAGLFMVGNPGETSATIRDTIELIRKANLEHIVVSPTLILPNSELYSLAKEKGIIDDSYWLREANLPYYTAEHNVDRLRYFRLKILFYHNLFRKRFSMALKLGILITGYKIIKLFKWEINEARDFLLKVPFLGSLIRKLKTDRLSYAKE